MERSKVKKEDFFTIPNILTYLRILIVPFFIYSYVNERYTLALVLVIISGISDFLDGFIARHFNMITDLGKVLDPIADKLSQAAVILCCCFQAPIMVSLLVTHILKEITMFFLTNYLFRQTGLVFGSKWYGKVCTFMLYLFGALVLVWTDAPNAVVCVLSMLCSAFIIFCLVMYSLRYSRILEAYREGGREAAYEQSLKA